MGFNRNRRSRARTASANPRGAGLKVAAVAGVVMIGVAALVFSTSFATTDIAANGLTALQGEGALGANDVSFKALGQLVLLAEDRELGVADDAVVAKAADEVRRSFDELNSRVDELIVDDPGAAAAIQGPFDAVGSAVTEILDATEQGGDPAGVLEERAKPAFEALRDALATHRTDYADSVVAAGDFAGRLSLISRFLVAFLLPLAAIGAYRVAARRQLRVAEVQLDAQLEAEHEIHKAKDEFIANMSHELRTPLTSIYGFSEILIETGLVDPEAAMDLICTINGESAELGRMVEDLLVSARSAANALLYSYQPVDLADEAPAVITPLTRTGATVEIDLPATPVWADPLRARQIIRNLVSNAIRHGGPEVRIAGSADPSWVSVAVMDNGAGVPDEMVPRLFTRFVHDGDEALTVGSVGLGLAVVKELATAMGGDASYRRSDGWSIFEFWLPVATESASEGTPSSWPSSTAKGNGATEADTVLSGQRDAR